MAIHIDDDDGAKDYYFYKTQPDTFYSGSSGSSVFPLTMSAWFKADAINDHDALISIGDSGSTYPVVTLNLRATGYATAEVKGQRDTEMSTAGSQYSADTWQHFCAVFTSASSRTVYQDGVAGSTNTVSIPVDKNDCNNLTIGEYATTWNNEVNGHISECALWNVALSASEVAILADGFTAHQVRPESLISYYPFVRDYLDVMGSNALTFATDGSASAVTYSPHTRIIEDAPTISRSAWGGI